MRTCVYCHRPAGIYLVPVPVKDADPELARNTVRLPTWTLCEKHAKVCRLNK